MRPRLHPPFYRRRGPRPSALGICVVVGLLLPLAASPLAAQDVTLTTGTPEEV